MDLVDRHRDPGRDPSRDLGGKRTGERKVWVFYLVRVTWERGECIFAVWHRLASVYSGLRLQRGDCCGAPARINRG
jgi:hypothetical protein